MRARVDNQNALQQIQIQIKLFKALSAQCLLHLVIITGNYFQKKEKYTSDSSNKIDIPSQQ